MDSDVDLFVVGDVASDELAPLVADAQRAIGRDIDVVAYRPERFREKRDSGNHFVTQALKQPRIDSIGGEDDTA